MASSISRFDREDEAWLRLGLVNLTAPRCRAALDRWRTPDDLLEAARLGHEAELLETRGITPGVIERLAQAATMDISRPLRAIEDLDIWLLKDGDALYPPALRAVKDRPVFLWVRGTLEPSDEIAIGIVGTRNVTEYGRGMAARIARDLAASGVTVVSGLARGIDTFAHQGALEGGGRTLACCGCGLDVDYPKSNRELKRDIVASGAMISEFAPTLQPQDWHFPSRNRIIAGLSAGIVVVEAAAKSGALITAGFAKDLDREVFALPGNVLKEQSRGPHGLIKDGAALIEHAEDILAILKSRSLPFERAEDFQRAATQASIEATQATQQAALEQAALEQAALEEEVDASTSAGASRGASSAASNQLEREKALASTWGASESASPSTSPSTSALPSTWGEPSTAAPNPLRLKAPLLEAEAAAPPPKSAPVQAPRSERDDVSEDEKRVMRTLEVGAQHRDNIALQAGLGAPQALGALAMLEIKRLVRRLPGGMFELAE